MRKVFKSYLPFLVWLVFAACSFAPPFSRASGDIESLDAKLRSTRALLAGHRWTEVARMKLPPADSAAWASRPEAESELVFARGLAAARSGFHGMAMYSAERLDALHARLAGEGEAELAREARARSQFIRSLCE